MKLVIPKMPMFPKPMYEIEIAKTGSRIVGKEAKKGTGTECVVGSR